MRLPVSCPPLADLAPNWSSAGRGARGAPGALATTHTKATTTTTRAATETATTTEGVHIGVTGHLTMSGAIPGLEGGKGGP
jgi:hypothetical protein